MYISLWENSRGHPDNVSFMQFSTKIDGFEQKDSQGFENSYNSYEQYPLEKFFIFTIYQNYTLALMPIKSYTRVLYIHSKYEDYQINYVEKVINDQKCIFTPKKGCFSVIKEKYEINSQSVLSKSQKVLHYGFTVPHAQNALHDYLTPPTVSVI